MSNGNGNGVSVVTDAVENVKEAATNVGETIAHAAEDAVCLLYTSPSPRDD